MMLTNLPSSTPESKYFSCPHFADEEKETDKLNKGPKANSQHSLPGSLSPVPSAEPATPLRGPAYDLGSHASSGACELQSFGHSGSLISLLSKIEITPLSWDCSKLKLIHRKFLE